MIIYYQKKANSQKNKKRVLRKGSSGDFGNSFIVKVNVTVIVVYQQVNDHRGVVINYDRLFFESCKIKNGDWKNK